MFTIESIKQCSHLYRCKEADTSSLLAWTKPFDQGSSTRPSRAENSKHYYGFDQQAGDAKYKADPKSCLLEPTRPDGWTTDEHQ